MSFRVQVSKLRTQEFLLYITEVFQNHSFNSHDIYVVEKEICQSFGL